MLMVRTVYMNSDLQVGIETDYKWLQKVGSYLDFWNVPWKAYRYENTPHYNILKKTTDDAVFMHNSLLCAGTIVDSCNNWFQTVKGSRKYLWNFYTPIDDYAFTVSWLPRAADDTFSAASFTGLSQPIVYMVKNGSFHVNSTIDARKVARRLAMLAYEK